MFFSESTVFNEVCCTAGFSYYSLDRVHLIFKCLLGIVTSAGNQINISCILLIFLFFFHFCPTSSNSTGVCIWLPVQPMAPQSLAIKTSFLPCGNPFILDRLHFVPRFLDWCLKEDLMFFGKTEKKIKKKQKKV